MSLYTKIASTVLFPLQERLKGHTTVKVLKGLEQSQWLKPEELVALQLERLKQFLVEVATHVPYYREKFAELAFDPNSLRSFQDLQLLPLTDKACIRKATEQLKSEHAQGLALFNTGGSSGEPLIFYIGKNRISHDVAAKWRATRWWDVDIGDPEIVVWGSPIELGAQDRVRQLRDKLMRTQLIAAFEMSKANLDGFVASIRQVHPRMLFGYPSSLALIADHAHKTRQDMKQLGIKVTFVTSERLYEDQREKIEAVFGCPVANGYGGRDAGFIAHQCPQGGMHITAEDIIVEIVDGNGDVLPVGASGEIVITHMATADFPFIRYRTGDVGALSDQLCACGRGLPLLQEIQGRTTDFVVASNGTVLHGLALIYVLRDMEGVDSFKIIQHSIDNTEVVIIANGSYTGLDTHRIREEFKKRLGQKVTIDVSLVDSIDREASGKYRYVVSHVELT
jgi:phenylacetate-coenzyme A ligase PaaK-like adenylate-forming protein